MKSVETKILPHEIKIVIGLICVLIATACHEIKPASVRITPAQQTSTRPSQNPDPKIPLTPFPIRTMETQTPEISTTEDENLRLSTVRDTYSISDTIQFDISVIAEVVYFHAPCDRWFERKVDQIWVKVGYCPDSDFTDEPGSFGEGDQINLNLPISREDEILYSYTLIPGTYRYAISYWTQEEGHLVIYSPEITITESE